jgi:2-phospho-L-lactate guanylyltransferase
MQVVVPVKSFAHAKSRLEPVLDSGVRQQLARVMAHSVLKELVSIRSLRRILVVSSEPQMLDFCRETGLDYLWDDGRSGLNGALAAAERELQLDEGEPMAVVCADLPFFRAAEFGRMLAVHASLGPRGFTLASDRYGRGTNVRIATVPGGLPYRFGEDSAALHMQEARRLGVPCHLFASEALGLDLDTPANALDVIRRPVATQKAADAVLRTLLAGLPLQGSGEDRIWTH